MSSSIPLLVCHYFPTNSQCLLKNTEEPWIWVCQSVQRLMELLICPKHALISIKKSGQMSGELLEFPERVIFFHLSPAPSHGGTREPSPRTYDRWAYTSMQGGKSLTGGCFYLFPLPVVFLLLGY